METGLIRSMTLSGCLATSPGSGAADKAAAESAFPAGPTYSPCFDRNYPVRAFFGDTHLHTSYSMDAGALGARPGPGDTCRFARGEQVVSPRGQPAGLSRPLDFLVVAAHSDGMGFFPLIFGGDTSTFADPSTGV